MWMSIEQISILAAREENFAVLEGGSGVKIHHDGICRRLRGMGRVSCFPVGCACVARAAWEDISKHHCEGGIEVEQELLKGTWGRRIRLWSLWGMIM